MVTKFEVAFYIIWVRVIAKESGKEKHLLYIGGNPYESEIIFIKDDGTNDGQYHFLHKDYLGSILAITSENGQIEEQRHFDAWDLR